MSSPAPPEPDEVDQSVAGDIDALSVPGGIPAPRAEPTPTEPTPTEPTPTEPVLTEPSLRYASDAVTQIMPVIAPWPAPGEETIAPPSLRLGDEPIIETIAGRASVPVVASLVSEAPVSAAPVSAGSTVDGPGTDLEIIDAVVVSDAPRPGPFALAEDSWDGTVVPIEIDPRRRNAEAVSTRVWVIVGLVLCALGAAIAIPFALTSQREPTAAPPVVGLPTKLDEPSQISADSSTGAELPTPLATAAAAMPQTSGSTSAAPVPSVTTTTASTPTSSPPPPPPPTTNPPPPPPFTPISLEAESGSTGGSANVWDGYPSASGGLIVRNLGNWGGSPGTLQLNGVSIPTTAVYTITIYFVHPDGEQNRSATVTVSGSNGMQVSFTGNATCCQTKVLNNITITAGTHSISFANATGHAPSIDRVVISRP